MPKTYDAGADASLKQFQPKAAAFKKLMKGHHDHGSNVRLATHKGHKIEIKTTYVVKIDGKKVNLKFAPEQDGSLLYHAVPNMNFASAVDLIRCLIDNFPQDFSKKPSKPGPHSGGHDHDAHDHGATMHTAPAKRAGKKRPAKPSKKTTNRSGHASSTEHSQ